MLHAGHTLTTSILTENGDSILFLLRGVSHSWMTSGVCSIVLLSTLLCRHCLDNCEFSTVDTPFFLCLEHIFFKKSFNTHDFFMISQTNRCMPSAICDNSTSVQ